ncbi:OX-2 membrane glycoprotein-like isoform X2 [Oxyura jamaicensis]|uniref:OX-2 membrane glycoprotein-like isoform X2 n=1 Tax=Oxyura jamaicensis TaxID=8884 RepID=UPI0015A72C24|nr:OX-2 membrane glycoprotein-like isoform X2 [Oxyura jamaicensis]
MHGPTMLLPWVYWAGICLLLLCRDCGLEEAASGVKEAVKSESFIAAALGGEAIIYCNFSLPLDVLQVTWQKGNGSFFQNIATYSKTYGLRLIGSFQKKAHFTRAALKASAITLQNLTFEDESCYRCIFNVFPDGSYSKDTCLNIQTISELTVEFESHLATKDLLTAVCSATGKPPPNITWLIDEDLYEPPKIYYIQNPNGTVTVANRCTFSASHLHNLACLLDHPQGRKVKTFTEKRGKRKSIALVVAFMGVISTVLIFFIIRLIYRKRKKLERPRAPSTPAREKGLEQDVSEEAANLCTPNDEHAAYQNEEQTPGSWLHKRLPYKKRNLEGTPRYSLSFPEEAESPDMLQRELAEVCDNELGCVPMAEHREATAGGEPESGPDTAAPQPST